MNKLVRISEVSKMLNLIDPITKKPLNHTLRYWESEFKEIKPKKINNHRYYSQKQIETLKLIKFFMLIYQVDITVRFCKINLYIVKV